MYKVEVVAFFFFFYFLPYLFRLLDVWVPMMDIVEGLVSGDIFNFNLCSGMHWSVLG